MKKFALLIGVNGYVNLSRLRYAAADAEETAKLLRQNYGFSSDEILLMTDNSTGHLYPSTEYIREQVQNLIQLENLDLLVFGFWGHGFARNASERYLCGILSEENRLGQSAVSLPIVIATLKQVSATNTCMILDCCQNAVEGRGTAGTLLAGERDRARDIVLSGTSTSPSLLSSPKSRSFAIMNSCDEGQRAYEWDDSGHSLFSAYFLEAMEKRIPTVSDIAQYVTPKVQQRAEILGKTQTPYCDIHGAGNIVLLSEKKIEIPVRNSATPTADILHVTPFMPEPPKAPEPLKIPEPPKVPRVKEPVPPPIPAKPLDDQISEGFHRISQRCGKYSALLVQHSQLLKEYRPDSPVVMEVVQKIWKFAESFLQDERQLRDLCKQRLDQLRAEGRLEGSPALQKVLRHHSAINTHLVRLIHEPRTLDEVTQMVQSFQTMVLGARETPTKSEIAPPKKTFYQKWLRIPTWITVVLSVLAALGATAEEGVGIGLGVFLASSLIFGFFIYPVCLVIEFFVYLTKAEN